MVSSDGEEGKPSTSASILKERRFKLSRACDRCRRRRIKCDEGHPCQACLGANSSCTFEEPGKRSHPHKSKRTATLEDRMHHLESLIQAIPPAVFAAGGSDAFSSPIDSSPIAQLPYPLQSYPASQPPPSINMLSVSGPGAHFSVVPSSETKPFVPGQGRVRQDSISYTMSTGSSTDGMAEETARMSMHSSYLYLDDEGYTRWQGETSGLPICDLLIERHQPPRVPGPGPLKTEREDSPSAEAWFPDRTPQRTTLPPERIWKLITTFIAPDLMDSLVQCYLSTSYYLMPFLHVPTFLHDYGNPSKWGEPGFAAFVVAVCCLASRHIDDPRVRSDPTDGVTSGATWFELFGRLRALPGADRPTVYTVQAVLVAGVYAVGAGRLSRAFALLAESASLSVDAGLHRSSDAYGAFDAIEDEIRKRTFWCVYMWDKQAGAHFGRPPVLRLRDCDVAEPSPVDDEYIRRDSCGPQPADQPSRMEAFTHIVRYYVVLEAVLDAPPARGFGDGSPFLKGAMSILSGFRRHNELREEEAVVDQLSASIPAHWMPGPDARASSDVLRVTHAERLGCIDAFVRMLIARHRFSECVAARVQLGHGGGGEQSDAEREAMAAAHAHALRLIAEYLQVATKGLMTYYGVHVIHQLTAAGRTLIAFLLNCQSDQLRPLIAPALEGLRSCVGLLKRFSGRYLCGQRSGDMMEEFCRITQIPLDSPQVPQELLQKPRPPWFRPLRKKGARSSSSNHSESPEAGSLSPGADVTSFTTPTANDIPFSTPENGVYGAGTLGGEAGPFSPGTDGMLAELLRAPAGSFDGATGDNIFGAAGGDGSMAMSPADLLAMFGDGSGGMGSFGGHDFGTPDAFGTPAFGRRSSDLGLATSPS